FTSSVVTAVLFNVTAASSATTKLAISPPEIVTELFAGSSRLSALTFTNVSDLAAASILAILNPFGLKLVLSFTNFNVLMPTILPLPFANTGVVDATVSGAYSTTSDTTESCYASVLSALNTAANSDETSKSSVPIFTVFPTTEPTVNTPSSTVGVPGAGV